MEDKIYDLLTQDKDVYVEDYGYPRDDLSLCGNICMRINYIRHLYQDYLNKHAGASFANDDVLRSYYMRLKLITPPFVLESII